MKHKTIVAAACLAVALSVGRAGAKSFAVERVHSDIAVMSDGTVRVTESITYRFDGSFSYAFRNIPLRAGVRVYDVGVAEGGNAYALSASEARGSYTVEESERDVVITWHYRARDEVRTFDVSYALEGAVARHDDVAEFYQTLFSNETGNPVGEVSARVTLPVGASPDRVRVFAHGPLHGVVNIAPDATVVASVAPLPKGAFIDVRVLLPPGLFVSMSSTGWSMLDEITAQERAWAAEADRQRGAIVALERGRVERARRLLPLSIALGLVALGVWFAHFRVHAWPHAVTPRIAPGEIPSDHPPAVVSVLLTRTVGGPAVAATLVDLADRGIVSAAQTERAASGWRKRNSRESDYRFERSREPLPVLRPFERSLLDFMVDEVGDGRGFSIGDLKAYTKKHRTKVRKWFGGWTKEVKEAARAEGFFEPVPVPAMVTNAVVGVAVAAAGAVISIATSSPAGVPAVVAGGLAATLTATLTRRTPEGRRLALAWKAFRSHLKSVSRAIGPVSLDSHDWARYLGAAILFGMHKRLVSHLAISDGPNRGVVPVWYHAVATGGDGGASGLADGFASMVASMASTMTSSTGSGGGAGAGGGGGAGGGSAGAG